LADDGFHAGGSAGEGMYRAGEGGGGMLNATFGNAAELVIALAALPHGLYDVVKVSIAGSIIGNILLVPGAAISPADRASKVSTTTSTRRGLRQRCC
jgi:calcium/proton exchanger cax